MTKWNEEHKINHRTIVVFIDTYRNVFMLVVLWGIIYRKNGTNILFAMRSSTPASARPFLKLGLVGIGPD
jgi:hypothetical protein